MTAVYPEVGGRASRPERDPAVDQGVELSMLRFTTAGSVDDGKSTLIGRLLHDAHGAYNAVMLRVFL